MVKIDTGRCSNTFYTFRTHKHVSNSYLVVFIETVYASNVDFIYLGISHLHVNINWRDVQRML